MGRIFDWTLKALSSLWLSVVLLILLGLLTWLGTLEQVHTGLYEVQARYFDSLFLVHDSGLVPIPLPGGRLVMAVLFVNLLLGGMLRMRQGWATIGVLITHIGIALLLVAGMVKSLWSEEGRVTMYEGERSNTYESYYDWEVAVQEDLGDGRVRERVVPHAQIEGATGARNVRLTAADLPFDVVLSRWMPHSRLQPRLPGQTGGLAAIDGFSLENRPLRTQAEANIAGAYVSLVEKQGGARHEGLLWGAAEHPMTVEIGGRRFAIDLRRERYLMPFTLLLDDFTKVDHPRTGMPKSFSSDVTVISGTETRPTKISMNEPLRQGGLVAYQSSWGPSNARPGEPLFSTLAVVRNPSDQHPLWATIVISIGLLLHFIRKLVLNVRTEGAK